MADQRINDTQTSAQRTSQNRRGSGGINGATIFGLAGVGILLGFVFTNEGEAAYFFNAQGLVIVGGGVTVVALLAFRFSEIQAAFMAMFGIFRNERSIEDDVDSLVAIARLLREHRVQDADDQVQTLPSPFLRLGLQLAVDGVPLDDVIHVLNWRIQKMAEQEMSQAKFFRVLASFSPAFGLLGTLTGMVGMLKQLGAGDIGKIGASMAVAMLATLYGLIFANLIFKPIAIKLEQRTARRVAQLNVLFEGIVLTHMGRSPTLIADQMDNLLAETKDEMRGGR
jgi:chemotaxis protein MotA